MTNRKASKPAKGEPGYVGRGHPPEHGKIRPGQVRNPYGRKGKARYNEELEFHAELGKLFQEPMTSPDGKRYSQAKLFHHRLIQGVDKGQPWAMAMYAVLREKTSAALAKQGAPPLDSTDEVILRDYAREILLNVGIDPDQARNDRAGDDGDDNDNCGIDCDPESSDDQ